MALILRASHFLARNGRCTLSGLRLSSSTTRSRKVSEDKHYKTMKLSQLEVIDERWLIYSRKNKKFKGSWRFILLSLWKLKLLNDNLPRGLHVKVYFFVKAFNMRVYYADVDVTEISFFLCPVTLLLHISLNDAMLMHVVKI